VARGGVGDQRKAGAVRRPKPKDHGGIGMNEDGAHNVVALGDQRKAGAVRRPKPKDHGGIGMNEDGAHNVVAPGDPARRNDRDRDITALVQIATLCDLSSCGGDAGSRLTAEAA